MPALAEVGGEQVESGRPSMRYRLLAGIIYRSLAVCQALVAGVSVVVSACLKADVTKLSGAWITVKPLLVWTQNWAWLILAAFGVVTGLAEIVRSAIGPPWVWDAIHHHLDLFQDYVFARQPGDMLHENRVTLFKHVKWRLCFAKWPWSGWLVPVERSGHTTRGRIAVFRAPDDAQEAEGIAGAAWASKWAVTVSELPDLEANPTDENIRAYAERTFVSPDWIRDYLEKRKQLARSFIGIPVDVGGKRWGVIVLDSKREMHSGPSAIKTYTLFSQMLGKLLEKV